MYNRGVYFGNFGPAHRGHLGTAIQASTECKELFIVVSHNDNSPRNICADKSLPKLDGRLKVQWLSQEFQDIDHIKVKLLDETNIPAYPNGWPEWARLMQEVVNGKIDVFYCGEPEYKEKLQFYFPGCTVKLIDTDRTKYPISATMVRDNPLKYWDYILGPARPYFAKKVLIAGTESCGKTTLTKYLAKLYHTSWSEEAGRYYASKYLGGNESIFTDEDFKRIAHLQYEQDYHALRTANKICFFDTDAVATQYYSELYMGKFNPVVESYVDPDKYDVVFLLIPDVEWVDDGMRLNGNDERRWELHTKLRSMYKRRGFKNIMEICGTYNERLNKIVDYIDKEILK